MNGLESPSHTVCRHLQKTIDDLGRDMTKVEMWADALSGFAQPIPEYDADGAHLLTHPKARHATEIAFKTVHF